MKALPALDARTYLPGARDAAVQLLTIATWSDTHCAGRIMPQLYRVTAYRNGQLLAAHLPTEHHLVEMMTIWRDDEGTALDPDRVVVEWLGNLV